jgi:hypothetical protein
MLIYSICNMLMKAKFALLANRKYACLRCDQAEVEAVLCC